MLPNLYRAGKLNIVVPAFGCYSRFFLHGAEPSVKRVEIVAQKFNKIFQQTCLTKITVHNVQHAPAKKIPKQQGLSDSLG